MTSLRSLLNRCKARHRFSFSMSGYPISGIPFSLPSGDGDLRVFDNESALAINAARMNHLESLGLPLAGRSVLDVGCGVGHLAQYFQAKGCRVLCLDARRENISVLRSKYPETEARVANVESDALGRFGRFDVVFCYGCFYHLENPLAALRNMASVCDELLLLETLVCDHSLPVAALVDEPPTTVNQTVGSLGVRPSPSWVAMALNRVGFGFIYAPATAPDYEDFEFRWKNDLGYARHGHPIRCVFVASRSPLDNPSLIPLLVSPQTVTEPTRVLPAVSQTWIDVGAHQGEKTLPHAVQDPTLRVFAFEPILRLAVGLAGRLPNFVVLPMAVGEEEGTATFFQNSFDAASSLLPFREEGLQRWIGGEQLQIVETISVPVIRLDHFLDLAGIATVDYLKVDAQGSDLSVVRSAGRRLRDIRRISLEVQITPVPLYEGSSTKEETISFLRASGFRLIDSKLQSHGQEANLTFERIC